MVNYSSSGGLSVSGSSNCFLESLPVELWLVDRLKSFLTIPVYAVRAPQKTPYPYVVYSLSTAEFDHDLHGRVPDCQSTFDIEICAKTYREMAIYAKALRDKLQGISGTYGATVIHRVYLDDESDDVEQVAEGKDDWYYIRSCSYRVKYSL